MLTFPPMQPQEEKLDKIFLASGYMYLWVEGESWILRVGGCRKGYGFNSV